MAKVLLDMAMSLDGCVRGPDGTDVGLYDWYFEPSSISKPVIDELVETTGAIVLGRGAFGTGDDASGWDDTPYDVPHVVITHRPPFVPLASDRFTFVTRGVQAAITLADGLVTGDRWVTIGGGADIARQCLAAGLVDEVRLHIVPILVGAGQRLFDDSTTPRSLSIQRVVDGPVVTHLRYRLR